jgi:hypothetical protein
MYLRMFKCLSAFILLLLLFCVCTRPHDCIVLLWQEAIACANKVLYYCTNKTVLGEEGGGCGRFRPA